MLLIVCRSKVVIFQYGAMKAAPSALRRTVADNVRRLRRALAMSQEELAAEAQLHRTYVGAIERAERNLSLDNIERLALALKVTPAALLTTEKA